MKNLYVFSSVGSTNEESENDKVFSSWNMSNYDSGCVVYGANSVFKYNRYFQTVDYHIGMKFPNFIFANHKYQLISKYQYFLIVDDDLIFEQSNILDQMIDTVNKYDLSICSISNNDVLHKRTPYSIMRYTNNVHELWITNFVEMGCMMIRSDLLDLALKKYISDKLTIIDFGWDIFLCGMANGLNRRIGIIKNLSFINPRKPLRATGRQNFYEDISKLGWFEAKLKDRINISC